MLLIISVRAFSQTFTSPTYTNSGIGPPSDVIIDGKYVLVPSDPVTIPASGNKSVGGNIQLHRPSGTSTAGYVNVYYGTSSSNLSSTPIASNIQATNGWLSDAVNPGNDVVLVTFNGAIISAAAASGYTGFYAVYFSTLNNSTGTRGAVSEPVLLKISSPSTPLPPPTPPPTPSPTQPLSYYVPCSGLDICSDQCVLYNATPALINGRVLATSAQDYTDYRLLVMKLGQAPFASYSEAEAVQWQYSYTNNGQDWQDISGANTRNYQPGPCTRTTYYRRSSTHLLQSFWRSFNGAGGYFVDHWYDSNVVTITPGADRSVPVQAIYNTCGNGNTTIAVQPAANAVSYNWLVPYAGWSISNDGTNLFSTYYSNRIFTTLNTRVVITIPNGVAPGDYSILFSVNGSCGPQSPDGTLTIRVSAGSSPVGQIGDYTRVRLGTGDATVTNLAISPVANATSYSAQVNGSYSIPGSLSGSQIVFATELPCSFFGQVTVTARSSCNSVSKVFTVKTPYCVNNLTSSTTSLSLYPNPATEQVVIGSVEQEATAFFYDAQGILRKQVTLRGQDKQTSINTQDLPAGLYHVSIKTSSAVLLIKQLLVQH